MLPHSNADGDWLFAAMGGGIDASGGERGRSGDAGGELQPADEGGN